MLKCSDWCLAMSKLDNVGWRFPRVGDWSFTLHTIIPRLDDQTKIEERMLSFDTKRSSMCMYIYITQPIWK